MRRVSIILNVNLKIVKSTLLQVFLPTFWQCCLLQGTKVRNRAGELCNLTNFAAGNFLMYIPLDPEEVLFAEILFTATLTQKNDARNDKLTVTITEPVVFKH